MSSKRGRKRNDNLPPNRARDVQRAFRARRAAHLEALENRVAELEEENSALRAALSLPPANRPPLGKGPTGKDKPKLPSQQQQPNAGSPSASSTLPPIQFLPQLSPTNSLPSMPVSRHDSPSSASTRTQSLSPTAFNSALGQSSSISGMDPTWDNPGAGFVGKDQPEPSPSASSTSYTIPPVPGPSTSHSSTYQPPASRPSLDDAYPLTSYQYSPERSLASIDPYAGTPSSGFLMRDERRAFTYQQPSFHTHAGQLHPHSSPVSAVSPSMPPGGTGMQPSYAHRRSVTEPQGYRSSIQLGSIPQMRLPQPPNLPNRLPSPSQLSGAGGLPPPPLHPGYGYGDERKLDRMR
ncbi:hypothetical protein DAEQUDRAFT_506107 [Daedalea quercina L-15889]|uniref:BZIP domain-containing protein n=1 Tax=Daedalea quercina L-15889 TaxID=1314783 RepID=A0A165T8Q6_9APHY|nr:hypothetical protein DAEQUDRAFT_506107 [Daedalea quercina L-15889]